MSSKIAPAVSWRENDCFRFSRHVIVARLPVVSRQVFFRRLTSGLEMALLRLCVLVMNRYENFNIDTISIRYFTHTTYRAIDIDIAIF